MSARNCSNSTFFPLELLPCSVSSLEGLRYLSVLQLRRFRCPPSEVPLISVVAGRLQSTVCLSSRNADQLHAARLDLLALLFFIPQVSHNLNSKLLKGGCIEDYTGDSKVDSRSLDYMAQVAVWPERVWSADPTKSLLEGQLTSS